MVKSEMSELLKAKRNPLFACVGCPDAVDYVDYGFIRLKVTCRRYANPTATFPIRAFGICPFNKPKVKAKKQFKRVGQQKQRKNK